MSNAPSPWLLKVIVGPHQGAELELAAGKTLIGSDDGCDVVFHDVLVAPQHLAIEAAARGLSVEPLGGRVYLGGKRIRDTRQKVDPFTFITIGGTHFVIGPVEGKWPLLSAADAPELEKEIPEPETAAESPATGGGTNNTIQAAPAVVAPASPPPITPARKRTAKFMAVFGMVLLAGWFFVFNSWKSQFPDPGAYGEKKTEASDSLAARARRVLQEHGVEDVVAVEEMGGRVYARGYLKDDAKLREIEIALRDEAPGINPRIWSLEKITGSARTLLKARGLEYDVQAKNEGLLTVIGVQSGDLAQWSQVRKELVELPGVKSLEDLVRSAEQVVAAPAPAPAPPKAEAAPAAPAPKAAAPRFPSIDTLEATVTEIAVKRGGLGFVRLSSGGVYFTGAKLPFGGVITVITEKSVTVRDNSIDRKVTVGQKIQQEPLPEIPDISSQPPGAALSTNTPVKSK